MKKLLVTRPEHDDTTQYLSYWSKKAVEPAASRGVALLDLTRERATKKEVTSMIEKLAPGLIIFNGHGSDDCVTGYKNEELITAGKNETLL